MGKNYLLACAMCALTLASVASEDLGCTLRQWQADEEFTLQGGQITQMFKPCQSGILEYVAVSAQSAAETAFSIRMKLYEVENGSLKLIHQQQGLVPRIEQTSHTVFTLTRDIDVTDERDYFIQLDIPQDRHTTVQYSGQDAYLDGELSVNHARFRGDLAFEVGVNPMEFYSMKTMKAPAVLREWSIETETPEYQCSISQPKYNDTELLFNGSYSQTFQSCFSGNLDAIWFQGDLQEGEVSIPVYLFERQSGAFVGASELNQHPAERHTLVAGFLDVEVKADMEYECFIDCSEHQRVEMRVVRNDGFFIGDFKHMHTSQDANLSFVAFVSDSPEPEVLNERQVIWKTESWKDEWASSVDVLQNPDATELTITFNEDQIGDIVISLYNLLGQEVESKGITSPGAGTQISFSTAGDFDQDYYSVRILQDNVAVVDATYRR